MSEIVKKLDPIFKPRSIAIIGANNNPAKWGGMMISRVLSSKFQGKVFPVNPNESEIHGLKSYGDITEIPDEVDLAVFIVPAPLMPKVMESCVKKGVKGGVIISADFAETGEKGRGLQNETVEIARKGGLRFVGPNGNGIFSSVAALSITPVPDPPSGSIAFLSQSGMFGSRMIMRAKAKGLGLSKYVAMGNQADISVSEYLEYLGHDPDTRVIMVYMEGFKNGRAFLNTAREVVKQKPVLMLKGGASDMGAKATLSHTASIAGEEKVIEGMCRQAGVIQVKQLEHLFIMAEALVNQPLPKNNRVAVVGNGGQGVAATDNLAALGLRIPELKEEDKNRLKELLPPHAPVPNNPVDFAAGALKTMDEVRVIEKLASFDYIDGIITNVPRGPVRKKEAPDQEKNALMEAIERFCNIVKKYETPIIAEKTEISSEQVVQLLDSMGVTMYNASEKCAMAMYALTQYTKIKKRSCMTLRSSDVN